jgi:hypothetical protein
MTEKEEYIHKWILEVSEQRPELGGLSICPYASSSKSLIVETVIDNIVPKSEYDVIIFIVENFLELDQVQKWVNTYNKMFPEYEFFEDCASKKTFINGVQTNNKKYNLILCQLRSKLAKVRKKLATTKYYNYWSDSYLQEILGNDYSILKNRDSNPSKSSDL